MSDPILMYVPGFAFLLFVNLAVAVPLALIIRNKRIVIPISVLSTTVVLKAIMVSQIGYFDFSFLLVLLGVGLLTSVLVTQAVELHRLGKLV
jgi:hypothetical protein